MDNVPSEFKEYAKERSYGKVYLHMWGLAKELGFKFGDEEKNINPANILSGNDLLTDCKRIFSHPDINKHRESEHYKYFVDIDFFKKND